MIRYFLIALFGILILSITGCYTQLAVNNNDESELYEEPVIVEVPVPILIIEPAPPPVIIITPPDPPRQSSDEPVYKYRTPQKDRPSDNKDRELIRDTGGRNSSGGRGGTR